MKVLVDTHVFLWWITDDSRLSSRARRLFGDGENQLFLSAASVWEMAIKSGLGKLLLPDSLDPFLTDQLLENSMEVLPIHLRHVLKVVSLPPVHRDPFDRLLIAQAMSEDMPLLSNDSKIKSYGATTLW